MTVAEDLDVLDVPDGAYNGQPGWMGMVRGDLSALLASSFPAVPTKEWFADPFLREPTPLTVSDDGRVYGHIATWHTSHIGLAGGVKPPRSRSRYAFFATGALKTAEGDLINVGQLTLSGGHAPIEASVAEAVAHYDDTTSAFADVAVGEDKIGIWVAGALRPEIDELKLRSIRASSVSGDWRPISGNLELVAVCAVNVPGFPIPRARVAAGATLALVAAGTEELVRAAVLERAGADVADGIREGLGMINERLTQVEAALVDRAVDRRFDLLGKDDEDVEVAADRVALRQRVHGDSNGNGDGHAEAETEDPLVSLRQRVHGNGAEAEAETVTPEVEALRQRVHSQPDEKPEPELPASWEDGENIELSADDAMTSALRRRAHGGVQATATKEWNAEKRKKAASSGAAMKDGSFPIKDCRDVEKAVHAMGRSKKSVATVKSHIIKRAKSLGCTKSLPDGW